MSDQEWMNEFEQALTKAMRRVDAPETLAKSLMAAVKVEEKRIESRSVRLFPRAWLFPKPRVWFAPAGFALAALLLAGVFTGARVHEQHEREAAATQQFEAATRITDQALEHTREQLAKAGVSLEQ
jgi:hypothetical protein